MTDLTELVTFPLNDLQFLNEIEVSDCKIAQGCSRRCSHCSQDPDGNYQAVSLEQITRDFRTLRELEEKTHQQLTPIYLHFSPDTDPFLHPHLAGIIDAANEFGWKFYIQTSGWFNNPIFQANAQWIVDNPDKIEKVGLTISNFPTNPPNLYENAEILINALKTLAPIPEGKIVVSPQYNAEVDPLNVHSEERTMNLWNYVCKRNGLRTSDFSGRIFPRPVVGIGRAHSKLKVRKKDTYRIEPENPSPIISLREKERPYSCMLYQNGLYVLKSPRGILNRDIKSYKKVA